MSDLYSTCLKCAPILAAMASLKNVLGQRGVVLEGKIIDVSGTIHQGHLVCESIKVSCGACNDLREVLTPEGRRVAELFFANRQNP